MKKRLLLLPLFATAMLASCSSYRFENKSYPTGEAFKMEEDPDMVVDGLAKEEHYKGLEPFVIYEPEYGVTVKVRTYFGQKGFYFFAESDDHSVFYNEDFQIYCNDGIEMQICVDPASTTTLANLNRPNRINESMLQIRSDVSNRMQTWVGNGLSGSYEWTQFTRPVKVASHIDGRANKTDGANGYSTEFYVPYSAFNLEEAPEEISIMPSFNNSSSNLDEERKWFAQKGMSHNCPSSWLHVAKDGFRFDGKGEEPLEEITGERNDLKFLSRDGLPLYEVDQFNEDPFERGNVKAFFDQSGVYLQFNVFDKEISRYNDNIWLNDGVEFYIDTVRDGTDNVFKKGVYRFAFDLDEGMQTDKCFDLFQDSMPVYVGTKHATSTLPIDEYGPYGYRFIHCYEAFIPFGSLGVKYSPSLELGFGFAFSSPGEQTYVLDRRDGSGHMEASSWLWNDLHYPKNAKELYVLRKDGFQL